MESQRHIALIADIGGNNARFKLISFVKDNDAEDKILKERVKNSLNPREFHNIIECIRSFLEDQKQNWPEVASIGIAGPVFDNTCQPSNVKHQDGTQWDFIIGDEVGKALNIQSFKLYNDFEIVSYAILNMKGNDLVQINDAKQYENKVRAVMGPGTGLGVSMIIPAELPNGKFEYKVFPCEGGHANFSPCSEEQAEFYKLLMTKFPEKGYQIGLEYCFTGPAIPYMYEFLKQRYPNLQTCIENDLKDADFKDPLKFPNKQVFEYGSNKKDQLCQKVVDFFLEILANSCGDFCLRTLCYSGLYICGNIVMGIKDYILERKDEFMKEYKARRTYMKLFDKLPIYIVMRDEIGLEGALYCSKRQIK